jgi:hypothetical protein
VGLTYDALAPDLTGWISRQHVFFVATAPGGAEGHVNVSPKGYDTFRVLSPTEVAYLDLTGSGVETIAHLRQDGRITIMFCAFEGGPRIVRLYGRGAVATPGDARFDELVDLFERRPGIRSVITVRLERISSSCGYSLPFLAYQGERPTLDEWAERRGADGIAAYQAERNRESIDGLPALG